MLSKRKRIVPTMADKLEIINMLKQGQPGKEIASMFGVGRATVTGIKKRSESIQLYVSVLESEEGSSNRKTMRNADNVQVDKALYKWYLQQKSAGQQVTGAALCEKARLFNSELGGPSDFKASAGWLRNFKGRHSIGGTEGTREKKPTALRNKESSTADLSPSFVLRNDETFTTDLSTACEIETYDPDLIYNARETGLYWKALPQNTFVSKRKSAASSSQMNKDRITVLACANSSGKSRLNLLLVGKPKYAGSLKDVKNLPVTYMNQSKGSLTPNLFTEWYDKEFIPGVKKYQESTGKAGKVLLVLESSPSHGCAGVLERENGNFKALILPKNATSSVLPMDQGIIVTLKNMYRKQLLRRLLVCEGNESQVLSVHKSLTLKECAYLLADSWCSMETETFDKAWAQIFGMSGEAPPSHDNGPELLEIISQIPGCSDCGMEQVQEWMKSDEDDHGVRILSDEEIVASLKDNRNDDDQDDEPMRVENEEPALSHAEACKSFETAMKWCEQQEECDSAQLLMLKRLRDMSAMKSYISAKQESLMNLFK